MVNLIHHTRLPMVYNPRATYSQRNGWRGKYEKPKGLWLSDEDEYGWSLWCNDEEFRLPSLRWRQRVLLKPDANILWLREPHELLAFQEVYGYEYQWPWGYADVAIDWERVTRDFDGLFISPYQWGMRLELDWYYTWDCASGCIWNLGCIKDVWSPAMEPIMKVINAKVILAEKRLDRLVDYFERRESRTFPQPVGSNGEEQP